MLEAKSARRYEVSARRDGRWVIDCLAMAEEEARARADELCADETIEAVRVVRGRFGHDGLTYESVIHEHVREARRGEAPVRIGRRPADDAWCDSLEDFYGPASRRAVARLLRNFLDRHAITPTELLHHHRYIRLLERQDALAPQALQRMAALQAAQHGVDARARLDTLNRFADEASARARDALASRAAPRLGDGGLKALAGDVAALAAPPADQAFYMRFAVSIAFEALGDPAEKLAMTLGWAETLPEALVPLVDELLAGLLGGAALIQHLLGPQAHLAAALATLADLSQGRAAERAAPLLASMAQVMGKHRLAETEGELIQRMIRELASDKPLSHDTTAGQRRLFDELLERLSTPDGLILGGPAMVEALARRSRRLAIIGGIDAVKFASDQPAQRIEQVIGLTAGILSERQERALATYLAALLDDLQAPPAELLPLRSRIASSGLAAAAKSTLTARLSVRIPETAA